MMMTEIAIETNGLTRHFGETVAVQNLSLTVEKGEVFGFLGHNGAGKTTTVRLLNGILEPDRGQVRVLGLTPSEQGPALRLRTGVLTETPSLEERLSGRQNLRIYAELYAVKPTAVEQRVDQMLETFALAERGDDPVGGYSKGMKQRLALARALLHDPELIFLDEPTSGLDPAATRQVHRLIRRLSAEQGRTIFLCTHNLAEAQSLCDRVGVMEEGRLMAQGTPAELARQVDRRLHLELEVDPESRAAATTRLQGMTGLTTQFDNGLLRVGGAERERIPDILAALIAADVRVYRAVPQEPSLADVYFALHETDDPEITVARHLESEA